MKHVENDEEKNYVIECDIFHKLTKKHKREDIDGIYCAIQAAMAYNCEKVDVGALVGKIMPRERKTTDCYCSNIGAVGLAFFHFLFDVKLNEAGSTDYHEYIFTRKFFPKTVVAYMKTASNPSGDKFRAAYNKQVSLLEKERQKILDTTVWLSFEEQVGAVLGTPQAKQ